MLWSLIFFIILLQLIWRILFCTSSSDHGTLGQLLSLLKRLPAATKPKENMHACTDALFTVLKGHILAAACKELNIDSIDSRIPAVCHLKGSSNKEKLKFVVQISSKVAEKCTIIKESILGQTINESGDGKNNYARTLCHFASLALEFTDAWAEGDGPRILRCWRVFLPHFSAFGRTKYALEALRLQFQLAMLPPHLVQQLTWGRFIRRHRKQHPL